MIIAHEMKCKLHLDITFLIFLERMWLISYNNQRQLIH